MINNSVSFGKEQSGTSSNILGAMGKSAVNVAATAGIGAAVGAGIGKLASLTPYKPTAADLKLQYSDMFVSAIRNEETPSYLQEFGENLLKTVTKGKAALKVSNAAENRCQALEAAATIVCGTSDEALKSNEVQTALKKLIRGKIAPEDFTKDKLLETIKAKYNKTSEFIAKRGDRIKAGLEEFSEAAGNSERAKELAEKGAKHLRNKTIIGAAIAIGVVGAFVINILNTYGIIKFPKLGSKAQQNQNGQIPAQLPNTMLNPAEKTTQG